MRLHLICLSLACGLLLNPAAAGAWGSNGHRITAKVAEDTLSDPARTAIRQLAGARSLPLLATWPDFIRSFKDWDCVKPWHFLTVEDGQDFDEAIDKEPEIGGNCDKDLFKRLGMPRNVVAAIDFFSDILRGNTANVETFEELMRQSHVKPYKGSTQLTALILVVHFVGDVHQPLHVGRGADRGGNSISDLWFDKLDHLHAVWDSGLIEQEKLSYTEFAAFLEQDFADQPPVEFGEGPAAWAKESVAHRKQVYDFIDPRNPAANLPKLSYEYAAEQKDLLQQRLYWGGKRLGQLLNKVFAGQ